MRGRDDPDLPDPHDGDPEPAIPSWRHNGAAVKEQSRPEVYLLFGNARFLIPSPDELVALGLSWGQVVTVADGALTAYARVPDRGTLVRARDQAEVWLSLGDRLWWVPTGDSMRFLGLAWNRVHVVPAGSLGALPQLRGGSAAATPASTVFAPDPPKKWPREEVPGYTLPNSARIVELRGWLRSVESQPNGADPDWHLTLEPDPAWLDQLGVNWTTFVKVGDILAMGLDPLTGADEYHGRVTTPMVHIELNGWQDDKHAGVPPPSDWDIRSAQGGQLDGVVWPFLPTVNLGRPGNPGLEEGQYVRVVGSLIHDIPHYYGQGGAFVEWWEHNVGLGPGSGSYNAAGQDWGGSLTEQDQSNPARWTEMHPPDLIERLDDRVRSESVYGLVAVARAAATNPFGHDQEVTVDLRPPEPRPPHTKAGITEYVGPETRFASITEGNADHSGAAITLFTDRAHVHVKVHGDGFAGAPGKFKAVYRLSWQPDPASYRLRASVQPASVAGDTSVTFTVGCVDADSGQPVAGTVRVGGGAIGTTGQPITHTFAGHRTRTWVPGDIDGPPTSRRGKWEWTVEEFASPTVDAPGYPSVRVPLTITGADDA